MKLPIRVQLAWKKIRAIFHRLYFPDLMYSALPAIFKSPAKAIFTLLVYLISLELADQITFPIGQFIGSYFGSPIADVIIRDTLFVSVTLVTLYLLKPEPYPESFLRGICYFCVAGVFFGVIPALVSQIPEWISNRPNFMWNPDEGFLNVFWIFLTLIISAIYEEAMFRGGFDAILRVAFGKWLGSFLQIGFFVGIHGATDFNRAIQLAMIGVILTLLRHSRYGIVASFGAHAAHNCLVTLLFGSGVMMQSIVPDYALTGILTIPPDYSYMVPAYVAAAVFTAIWLWKDARVQKSDNVNSVGKNV
jgi:membrane protease YdiL (CAAX protease family)